MDVAKFFDGAFFVKRLKIILERFRRSSLTVERVVCKQQYRS